MAPSILLRCAAMLLAVPGAVAAGDLPPPGQGRWHPAPPTEPEEAPPDGAREALDALPYAAGSRPAPARTGVVLRIADRVAPGAILYNSGHGPEALLVDRDGRVLHRWRFPVDRVWPDAPEVHQATYFRRVTLLPDGGLLAVFEGIGLVRLDRDSNLEWAYGAPVHHQAIVDGDGSVWTLVRRFGESVAEDVLTRLGPDGAVLAEVDLLAAFQRSPFRSALAGMKRDGDLFHTNAVEWLDGRHAARAPWMRRGNLLLSMYFLDVVCVVDPERGEVVWAMEGKELDPPFHGPHDPHLLDNGHLLFFDNRGRGGQSRVVELDPGTHEVVWQYPADPETRFLTPTCGTCQRLPNGNTLLTESDAGRALEVTPRGETVWEFLNPHRAGTRDELIATLFEVRCVPADALEP